MTCCRSKENQRKKEIIQMEWRRGRWEIKETDREETSATVAHNALL